MLQNEKEIQKSIKKGSLKEFENLFRNFYPQLCRYATRFTKDNDQAEEVVQEVFYQFWKNRKQMQIHTSLQAYLYKATYNTCLQYLRRKGQERKYEDYLKQQKNKDYSPVETIYEKEISEIIQSTLQTLPQRCSLIFTMNRFEGLKYREIAEKLEISVKTVEADMGKALKAFRENLKDYAKNFTS